MNKIILLMIGIFLISLVSAENYYVTTPTACPNNYQSQTCSGTTLVCGYSGGVTFCYDMSTLSAPAGSITTTGTGGTDYTCSDATCNGGLIIDCYSYDGNVPHCDTGGGGLCDRNATCYNKHVQTTCKGGAFVSHNCSNLCISLTFACDSDTTDTDGCEISAGASCGSGTGTIVLNQCYSATAGNCTSSTRLDCNNDDSDSNSVTCNGADGCEITKGGACTLAGLVGTYGSTCTGSAGTCVLTKKNFITGNFTQYSTNATESFLWGRDWGVGNLMNLTSNNNFSFVIDNQTNIIANNSNFTIGNKITMTLGIIWEAISSTWVKLTGSLFITGNLNVTGNGEMQNLTIRDNKLCNQTSCFTLQELNTTGGGGDNASWNKTYADSLYTGIIWNYNQTTATFNLYNSTWDNSFMNKWNYNQTISAITDINSRFWNKTQTYNKTEIDNNLTFYLLLTDQRFNETALINSVNTSVNINNLGFLNKSGTNANQNINISPYNITASWGFLNLVWSYIQSIPNLIYGLWTGNNANNLLISNNTAIGYNETVLNNSIINVGLVVGFNSTSNLTYAGLMNNASYLSTSNLTYAGLMNNASYLSTYNVTYAGLMNNASYLSTYNISYLEKTGGTMTGNLNLSVGINITAGTSSFGWNGTCWVTKGGTATFSIC